MLWNSHCFGKFEVFILILFRRVSNFSVNEGRSRVLVSEYLDISNRHFDDRDIDIYVIQQPTNGLLESSRDSGRRLEEFSFRLARAEFLFYTHDGSDTLQVSFFLCDVRIGLHEKKTAYENNRWNEVREGTNKKMYTFMLCIKTRR